MRKIPRTPYQTPSEVEVRIAELRSKADATEPGLARQAILIEMSKLRAYADMKRWMSEPAKRN